MSAPEVADSVSEGAPPLTPEHRQRRGGFLRWLLLRDELSSARENAIRFTAEQREYLRRAKVALELGTLALGPGNVVRSGSPAPLAANLFRESLYWALLSQRPELGLVSSEAIWAAADGDTLASIGANDDELVQIAAAMRSTFKELAEGTPETQRMNADLLQRSATRMVTRVQRPLWQLEWVKLKRAFRLAVLALACLVPLALALVFWPPKPDLAKGKPWHTSSIGIVCHPEKSDCGGVPTDIFFHTKVENNPWFEYDFGSKLAFSSLTIRNRSDFGPERAVPLVVEVSNDDKKFQEIARRTESFSTWKPSFPTQHARYLRLRVTRETCLHLEAVEVHP